MDVPWKRDRGGFAFAVDTRSGEVQGLRSGVAVKYHTPGCGTGPEVALLTHLGIDQERTLIEVVDTQSTATVFKESFEGQITSAAPVGSGVVAARDKGVVALSAGEGEIVVARTPGRPYQLRPGRHGVGFLVAEFEADLASVWHANADWNVRELGEGALRGTNLAAGKDGDLVVVGSDVEAAPDGPVRVVHAEEATSTRISAVSARGRLLTVNPSNEQTAAATVTEGAAPSRLAIRPDTDQVLGLVDAAGSSQRSGESPTVTASPEVALPYVDPADAVELGPPDEPAVLHGGAISESRSSDEEPSPPPEPPPGLPTQTSAQPSGHSSDGPQNAVPALYDREASPADLIAANFTTPKCAVPRNSVTRQVHQPNSEQVNWAIQQATRNLLKGGVLTRPAGYANLGLAAYQPSNDFARHPLAGHDASVPVPPSVIQGTYAQESNWLQASPRALPGVAGNPNIGDYYGAGGTLSVINYNEADCGYGVAQVTDPMTAASFEYSPNGKTKVAVDYAENIAAGIQFLVDKWNLLHAEAVTFNGGSAAYLENWWGALWAYNSGYNAPDWTGAKGLGWTNNPMNADYPPNRSGFLRSTYADAETPNRWSYPERVAGWMETPQLDYSGTPKYITPTYASGVHQLQLPEFDTFCTSHNHCSPDHLDGNLSYCTRSDRHCWWHQPVDWTLCTSLCATSHFNVPQNATEPAGADNYPPNCNSVPESADLPRQVIIVDDQPNNINIEGCVQSGWSNAGTFSVTYGTESSVAPVGQIDWHQLGTGFGGHVWFTKNRLASDPPRVNTATWTPSGLTAGLYSIQAHFPPSGASTPSAHYKIHLGNGTVLDRWVDQHLHENRWVTLGAFNLVPGAKVELSNVTGESASYTTNVAFDAVAFVPTRGTPQSATAEAVAVFDHDQNLDTASSVLVESVLQNEADTLQWANELLYGSGASNGILDYTPCTGPPTTSCVGPQLMSAAAQWALEVDTTTIPRWLGYSNDVPAKAPPGGYFDDSTTHKQLNRLTFDFLVDSGAIVEGSMVVSAAHVTGTGHMPPFMLPVMAAIEADYGIPAPDLSFSAVNLGTYSHNVSYVDPSPSGEIPGRAFRPYVTTADYDGPCAAVASVDGGTNPWKAFLNEGHVAGGVEGWKNLVQDAVSANEAPEAVGKLAAEIFDVFFSNDYGVGGFEGSIFRKAPPIWVEQTLHVCADGSIQPSGDVVARNGYMPDLYVFVNGHAVFADGTPQPFVSANEPAAPIALGEFAKLANPGPPFYLGNDHPWTWCGDVPGEPRHGNPWGLGLLFADEAKGDDVSLCSRHFVHEHGH